MATLTFELSENATALLKRLAKEEGISEADVLRRALALYSYLQSETKDPQKKLSITSTGENEEVLEDIALA